PEDLGRVIGKRGATAQSLRTLLRALGTKNDARYNLKIVDTGSPEGREQKAKSKMQKADDQASDSVADTPINDSTSTAADDQTVTDELEEQLKDESTASENADSQVDDQEDAPESDLATRTRAELADLDDLEV